MSMWKRLLHWAFDLYSPGAAALGLPCRYTLRGALRGTFDRASPRRPAWIWGER